MFINSMKRRYERKNIKWDRSDDLVWGFWVRIAPIIIWIPILFWLMKWILIDYLLKTKGFETAVMYLAIILIIRPLIMDLFTNIVDLKKK